MLYRLFMLFDGFVKVRATGIFAERFINLASHAKIRMWDIERGDGELRLTVSAISFGKLRQVARAAGVRLKIEQKNGLPFIYKKYRRRKALILGAAVFILSIYAGSLILWDIEVTGCEQLSPKAVEQTLEKLVVRSGAYISKIDIAKTEQLAMLEIAELSFIAINIKGVRANVEIRERVPVPSPMTPARVRSLAASCDGLIERMEVYKGAAMVERGMSVQKGDIKGQ